MAITNISSVIELGSKWSKVDLGDLNSFYLIGIKEEKENSTDIDPKAIKILNFEVGIESGIKDTYLTIGHITLNFDEFTSKDSAINKVTAMTRCLNYPSIFYIKPSDAITYDNVKYAKGNINIDINLNAVKLK